MMDWIVMKINFRFLLILGLYPTIANADFAAGFNSGILLGTAISDLSAKSQTVLPHANVLKAEREFVSLKKSFQREVELIVPQIIDNFKAGKSSYTHYTGIFDSKANDWLTLSESQQDYLAFFNYFRNRGYRIERLPKGNSGFMIFWD